MSNPNDTPEQPVILEGEILNPGMKGEHKAEKPRIRVIKIGWFGKIMVALAILTLLATAIVLVASAFIILLPLGILAALWGWWMRLKYFRKPN